MEQERPLVWIGSSRKDVRAFPAEVRRDIGYALYAAQHGQIDPSAKPLRGFGGARVLEIIAQHSGDTWRAVYTVRYADAVYVLHISEEIKARHRPTAKGHGSYPPTNQRTLSPSSGE